MSKAVRVLCVMVVMFAMNRTRGLAVDPARPGGVVYVVGGIGGWDPIGPSVQWALPQEGIPHEVHDFLWTHGVGRVLVDLQDYPYLQARARELTSAILRVKQANPNCPVYLVGKSGGTEIVLSAAEHLPPGTLERIILVSPAVAPQRDLRPALRATKKELVCFYSRWDRLILGWGTSRFGTADRHYGPSAGKNGFVIPDDLPAADRELYHRLIQIPWRPRMMFEGDFGRHYGNSNPIWVRNELTPWLKP